MKNEVYRKVWKHALYLKFHVINFCQISSISILSLKQLHASDNGGKYFPFYFFNTLQGIKPFLFLKNKQDEEVVLLRYF